MSHQPLAHIEVTTEARSLPRQDGRSPHHLLLTQATDHEIVESIRPDDGSGKRHVTQDPDLTQEVSTAGDHSVVSPIPGYEHSLYLKTS